MGAFPQDPDILRARNPNGGLDRCVKILSVNYYHLRPSDRKIASEYPKQAKGGEGFQQTEDFTAEFRILGGKNEKKNIGFGSGSRPGRWADSGWLCRPNSSTYAGSSARTSTGSISGTGSSARTSTSTCPCPGTSSIPHASTARRGNQVAAGIISTGVIHLLPISHPSQQKH